MTKEIGSNGKLKHRIKGFNGTAIFKTRQELKTTPRKQPINPSPVELTEKQRKIRDDLAANPAAQRLYTESIKRLSTPRIQPPR